MNEKAGVADRAPSPATFYCTVFAWFCCASAMALIYTNSAWWVVLAVMGLLCLSFFVSIAVDFNRLTRWSRADPGGQP